MKFHAYLGQNKLYHEMWKGQLSKIFESYNSYYSAVILSS